MSGAAPRAISLSGPGVSQPSVSQGNYRWFQVVTLAAGSYTLAEANHPAWKGPVVSLRLDPVGAGGEGELIRIKSIVLEK